MNNITISRYCCVYWRTFIIIFWYNTTGWIILNWLFVKPTPSIYIILLCLLADFYYNILLYKSLKDFYITVVLSLTQRTHKTQVQNMPPNTDHAHNKHIWTTIYNFGQLQVITPWWWILCDPKHIGVIFNVSLNFYITQILTSMAVIIECVSWLINVSDTIRNSAYF